MHDLNELMAFRAVALNGGFNAAARQLNKTSATLSRCIARLEEDMGVRLFHRTTRNLSLTPEGQSYFEAIEPGIQQILAARDSVANSAGKPGGVVRIQMSSLAARMLMLPALPGFMKTYPDIKWQILSVEVGMDLVKENIDLAIHFGHCIDCSYISVPLAKAPIFLMASPAYLERCGAPKSVADLVNHNVINGQITDGPVAWKFTKSKLCRSTNFIEIEGTVFPKGNMFFVNNFSLAIDATLSGMGISACDTITASDLLAEGELKILLPDYNITSVDGDEYNLKLSYPGKKYMPKRVMVARDFVLDLWKSKNARAFDPYQYAWN